MGVTRLTAGCALVLRIEPRCASPVLWASIADAYGPVHWSGSAPHCGGCQPGQFRSVWRPLDSHAMQHRRRLSATHGRILAARIYVCIRPVPWSAADLSLAILALTMDVAALIRHADMLAHHASPQRYSVLGVDVST